MRPDLKVGTREFRERCPSGRRSTPGERMFREIGTVGLNPPSIFPYYGGFNASLTPRSSEEEHGVRK